ncbi:MAG: MFS transporter, partial [Pseudomonadota bacterium]
VTNTAQGLLEIVSGPVTERLGEIKTLAAGIVLAALGYVALSEAGGIVTVTACLFLVGIGTAFQHAPSSALIVRSYPLDGRRGPLGLYNSSGDAGKLVFSGLFSFGIGAGLAWQQISAAYGLIALAATVAILLVARAAAELNPRPRKAPTADTAAPGWGILDKRAFGALFTTVFLDTMVQTGLLVFVAFLMIEKDYPLETATFAAVVLLVGGIFGKAGCGFLAQRMGIRSAFALIQAMTAAGLLALVLAPGWLAFLILVPLGAVAQGSTSITYGFVADLVHPDRMARGYALMYGSAGLSSAAGPLVFGVVADTAGLDLTMAAMAVVSLLAVPPLYVIGTRQTA